MPLDAVILTTAFQEENLCMWAEVNPEFRYITRNFHAFPTGAEIPACKKASFVYIGTAHTNTGLVFHAYERFDL